MQLTAVPAATPADQPPAPPAPPAIRNVHLTSHVATSVPGVTDVTTLYATFVPRDGDPYGGHRSTIRKVDGQSAGIGLRAFVLDAAERQAAQAVLDAIVASGLLQADLPPLDWKTPEVGRTRLYLDRRSRFLEFDTGAPPAVAQPILQALVAYEQAARRLTAAAA